LQAQLTPREQTRLTSARRVNPEAYEAYLKGIFSGGSTREDTYRAEQYFMLALEKQPDYAPAYAGIARMWGARQQYGFVSPKESGPHIVEAAEKALALDDSLADVHYTLGRMKVWTLWDFPGGEASFRRSIELDPNFPDPRVFYARLLNFLLRPAEALPQIERALELDPHNTFFRAMYAIDLCFASRYDDAIAQARQALMDDPDEQQAEGALRIAYIGKGMIKEAMEANITAIIKRRRDLELAQVLQRLYDQGRYTEAAKAGAELLEERVRQGQFVAPGQLSSLYGLAGLPEKALEWVEKSVEQRDPNVLGCRHLSRNYPELEANPRFQAILRRIGLPLAPG
jgi:tetratricopeptide (TPR) repeat protein